MIGEQRLLLLGSGWVCVRGVCGCVGRGRVRGVGVGVSGVLVAYFVGVVMGVALVVVWLELWRDER